MTPEETTKLIAELRADHATGFNCRCLYLCDALEHWQAEAERLQAELAARRPTP